MNSEPSRMKCMWNFKLFGVIKMPIGPSSKAVSAMYNFSLLPLMSANA